jgi:peptidyl-prolyl cis-trans isomerase SurA
MRLARSILALSMLTAPAFGLLAGAASAQDAATFNAADLPELAVIGAIDPTLRKAQAIVNGDVITDTDIDQRMGLVLAANGNRVTEEERPRLRLQVLRNLIDEKLQVQEAKSNDITITDDEVEKAFVRVSQNFKRAPTEFDKFLRDAGSSPSSLKQQIRGELAWNRVLRRKVEPFVNVGDEEVQSVVDKLNAAKGKDEFHVGEIFLSATPENVAQVEADAARIVEQVRGGASFVAYARQFSEASSAGVGGDLGWVRAEQLNDAVAPVVTSLTPGNPATSISDPVRVPGGVAVMALIEKRQFLSADPAAALLSLKQMSLALPEGTTREQGETKLKDFQAATQNMGGCGAVEAVAKRLGAEVASNDALRLKDLPGPLQEIMSKLSIGQASPAFGSSREGLRVLVLCGRDDTATQVQAPNFEQIYAQMNDERVNMRARRYLRDLRRDAIVDYR